VLELFRRPRVRVVDFPPATPRDAIDDPVRPFADGRLDRDPGAVEVARAASAVASGHGAPTTTPEGSKRDRTAGPAEPRTRVAGRVVHGTTTIPDGRKSGGRRWTTPTAPSRETP
jgi:hypothetical protein